ncbi:hypothetical protein BKA15_000139 [Microlunatus parietis]|uniref:Uncharacterized protein n=1 Tax=Microlunatus parietis TaxID=682979 RepID=A0A7Y9I224_9ACTN|nr:hypothetical protein [Microlunatus parietis]
MAVFLHGSRAYRGYHVEMLEPWRKSDTAPHAVAGTSGGACLTACGSGSVLGRLNAAEWVRRSASGSAPAGSAGRTIPAHLDRPRGQCAGADRVDRVRSRRPMSGVRGPGECSSAPGGQGPVARSQRIRSPCGAVRARSSRHRALRPARTPAQIGTCCRRSRGLGVTNLQWNAFRNRFPAFGKPLRCRSGTPARQARARSALAPATRSGRAARMRSLPPVSRVLLSCRTTFGPAVLARSSFGPKGW